VYYFYSWYSFFFLFFFLLIFYKHKTTPDPKNRFGAGVPLTPSNDILQGAGTAPFPGINSGGETVMGYGTNSPSKFEDPHPPPEGGAAWNHQSSIQNPQYQQKNTFVKAAPPPSALPQFIMPKRRLR
jgi:hypothetical protein